MIELRRTMSGGFTADESYTLHEIRDAVETGNTALLEQMILPPEKAISDIPKIVIRDRAADAVAHGASLASPGVLSVEKFKANQSVVLVTTAGKLVALSKALFDSDKMPVGQHGIVAVPTRVFAEPIR
jgi:tRNA pseudouridine55 synthase/H/ACA ribonucleoprotein complex subunit 4